MCRNAMMSALLVQVVVEFRAYRTEVLMLRPIFDLEEARTTTIPTVTIPIPMAFVFRRSERRVARKMEKRRYYHPQVVAVGVVK